MGTFSKIVNVIVQMTVVAIAGIIIFRTVKNAGFILYSLHPVFHSIGVSVF